MIAAYQRISRADGDLGKDTIAPVILWDSSRVWKILTAYVYTGAMVLGKTKTLISGKSIVRTVPKGQQFITEGTHEAIVSREEFEKAQLVIKSNSHKAWYQRSLKMSLYMMVGALWYGSNMSRASRML